MWFKLSGIVNSFFSNILSQKVLQRKNVMSFCFMYKEKEDPRMELEAQLDLDFSFKISIHIA